MDVLYILLGWLFGILSPGIVKRISDNYKKIALRKAIISELKDIKKRLVYIPIRVYPAYGTLDIDTFKWVQEQTDNFTDFISDGGNDLNLGSSLENDTQIIAAIAALNNRAAQVDPAFHFKKMEVDIIESNLINIEILDDNFLSKLLAIKFYIKTFNEEAQSVNEYLKMTFDSNIQAENHRIISQEIKNKNNYIAKKAMDIVDKINNIIGRSAV